MQQLKIFLQNLLPAEFLVHTNLFISSRFLDYLIPIRNLTLAFDTWYKYPISVINYIMLKR